MRCKSESPEQKHDGYCSGECEYPFEFTNVHQFLSPYHSIKVPPAAKSADAETLVTRLEDRFSDSMTLLKRIPVTLTLEVSSVEIMLADLLNIDDDTVIELDKLAGEPLDIKVNNILLGKAEVVVVNEKYGLRVLEFNTRDINDLAP